MILIYSFFYIFYLNNIGTRQDRNCICVTSFTAIIELKHTHAHTHIYILSRQ